MNCKKIAIIKFSDDEIGELNRIVDNNDFNDALKILSKIDKRITDFLEPH